jgi:hypothetical protein
MTHAERHDKVHSLRATFKCVFGGPNGLDSDLLSLPAIEALIAPALVVIAAAAIFAIYAFGRVAQRKHDGESHSHFPCVMTKRRSTGRSHHSPRAARRKADSCC